MPDFLKPYYNKENISYTTFTCLLIQKEIYLQKASYAPYKHISLYFANSRKQRQGNTQGIWQEQCTIYCTAMLLKVWFLRP